MYQFRKATPEDLDYLVELEKENFDVDRQSTKRSLQYSIVSPSQNVILLEEGTLLGAAILQTFKHAVRLYSIAINKGCSQKGYGTLLLKYCEDYARGLGIKKMTLEADSSNEALVGWYKKNGYIIKEILHDYYSEGHSAVRMFKHLEDLPLATGRIQNIVISDMTLPFMSDISSVEIVSSSDYISQKRFGLSTHYRIFNCLNGYSYQSKGYYMSLLAAARDHRVIPSVATINDFTNITLATSISYDIQQLIDEAFAHETSDCVSYPIIFTHDQHGKMTQLSKALYKLFESPFIRFEFVKTDKWLLTQTELLTLEEVLTYTHLDLHALAKNYFSQKKFNRTRIKNFKYDLAILVNPQEKNPPSNTVALQKFKKAGERQGFFVEFIHQYDGHRINEFDALLIRETTHVANHTYHFSRHAHAEGLVVLDDPWSILKCSNKFYLQERMRKAKIKMPDAVVLQQGMDYKQAVRSLKYPLVIKQPDSAFSLGVYKVKTDEELESVCTNLLAQSEFIIAQAYLPTDFDWRIGILDNQPIFACKYMMAKGHWQIYNWSGAPTNQEGDSITLPLNQVPKAVMDTAIKAASYIGDGLYGVDLKEVNGVPYLIEINDNPNIDAGIEDVVAGDSLYDTIILSIKNRILKARNTTKFINL